MREGIHPNYVTATVTCACGNQFTTRSTKPLIKLVICSKCHPFYTGQQKLVDAAGRVDKFQKRFEKTGGQTIRRAPVKKKAAKPTMRANVLSSKPVRAKASGAKGAPEKKAKEEKAPSK